MVDLSKVTGDELRKEIERRKIALTKPQRIAWTSADMFVASGKLRELCQDYINSLAGDGRFKDAEYHIFEAAITLFYGVDAWNWINERVE